MKYKYQSADFDDPKKVDTWLNEFSGDVQIVGYSAYGVGDVRNHTEFTAGVFITIKYDID